MDSIDRNFYQLLHAIYKDAKPYDPSFSHYASIVGIVCLEEKI
jgi:hypothetical protein